MPAAHLAGVEHQAGIKPPLLHRFFDMVRQIGNRRRTARQLVERGDRIAAQLAFIQAEMRADHRQIALGVGIQRVQPVHQFHVGIAAQLAETERGFDGFEGTWGKTAK